MLKNPAPSPRGSHLRRNLRGSTLLEYGLLGGFISVAAVGGVLATGVEVEDVFCRAAAAMGAENRCATGMTNPGNLLYTGMNPEVPTFVVGQSINSPNFDWFDDPQGDTLTFRAIGAWPSGIAIDSQSPEVFSLSGTPPAEGTWSGLRIEATDGTDTALSEVFEIVVGPMDPAPVYISDSTDFPSSIPQGHEAPATAFDWFRDGDGSPLTFEPVGPWPPGLEVVAVDGDTFRLTGHPEATGTWSGFQVSATDGTDTAVSRPLTITISDGNEFPVYTGDTNDVPSPLYVGQAMTPVDLTWFNDPEMETLSYDWGAPGPDGLSLTRVDDTTVRLSGTPTQVGTWGTHITAADPHGASVDSEQFTISTILPPNDAPTFVGNTSEFPSSFIVDQPITPFDLNWFADANDDDLVLTSSGLPNGLVLTKTGKTTMRISGTPDRIESGGVRFEATDPRGESVLSDIALYSVDLPPNDPPVFIGNVAALSSDTRYDGSGRPIAYFPINEPYTGTFTWFSDPDGDPITIEAVSVPSGLTLTDNGNGSFTLAGTPDTLSSGSFRIEAGDARHPASVENDELLYSVHLPPNDPPQFIGDVGEVASDPAQTTTSNGKTYVKIARNEAYDKRFYWFDDPQGADTLTLIADRIPAGLSFTDHGDGSFSLSGTPTQASSGIFRIYARDDRSEQVENDDMIYTVE